MSTLAIGTLAKFAFNSLTALIKNRAKEVADEGISSITADSIIEMSKASDMEYITVIDEDLALHESTTDVLKYINSLCAGWTLSAASLSTSVGNIKTVKLLEKINPSKSPSYAIANTLLQGAVTYSKASGFVDDDDTQYVIPSCLPTTVTSLEASFSAKEIRVDNETVPVENYGGARTASDLSTVQNLSVGQMVTLTVTDGTAKKDINISIRLVTVPTSKKLLTTILSWSQQDNRVKSRFRAWRTGELEFWRGFILMRDVFTERKRILMNDNSDLLQTMLGRSRDSMVHSVLTATPSVGTMSSVLVISADTLRQIERTELDGRLKDFRFRQRIMNATGIMLIVVVDPLSELVTVYTHTKSLASEFSIRQMKAAGKGGNDLTEILKLLNQNSASSF